MANSTSLGYIGLEPVFRQIIPLPQDRIPLTWNNVHYSMAYVVPACFMTYLVRRRGTKFIRLALLPIVIAMAIRGTFHYATPINPETWLITWLRTLQGFSFIALSIDCALFASDRLKIGEKESDLPPMFHSITDRSSEKQKTRGKSMFPSWLVDIVEVQTHLRGIGWNFGKGVFIPPNNRNLERGAFLRRNVLIYFGMILATDACQTFYRHFPGLEDPLGGTIWNPNLRPLQRYILSTLIHSLMSVIVLAGLVEYHAFSSGLGVAFFGYSPEDWPPVCGNPWKADSVHNFWSRQWHALFRRTFVVLGGIPGYWLAGQAGGVLGTFLASGLFHELGFYLLDRGLDPRGIYFFLMQGVAILLEKAFTNLTGRRVCGWPGRIWAYIVIVGFGQILTDSWCSRGIAQAIFVPEWLSPCEYLLAPLYKGFFNLMTS